VSTLISKRLKEARQAKGISQKQLGIEAGIDEFSSSARVNQYETGKHVPDLQTAEKMAEVLGVPAAFFYARDDQLAEVIRLFGKLDKNIRSKAVELLHKFQER
jgi:transcriptional regulator with XRE-family HTH domain